MKSRYVPHSLAALALATLLLAATPANTETPAQPGWIADPASGCRLWSDNPQPGQTVTWSGACTDGVAQGQGVAQWSGAGSLGRRYEGEIRDGKETGEGSEIFASGSRYDGDGVLRDWWTAEDHKKYDAIADRLVRQFDGFEPLPGHHIDGRLTLSENIADLVDPGSFVEYGALTLAAQRSRRSEEDLIANTPADGLVAGVATIGGAEVAVLSYDYTVLAGTQGMRNHAKTDRVFDLAARRKLPVVLFAEGGGGRPGDTDLANIAGLDVPTFRTLGARRRRARRRSCSAYWRRSRAGCLSSALHALQPTRSRLQA